MGFIAVQQEASHLMGFIHTKNNILTKMFVSIRRDKGREVVRFMTERLRTKFRTLRPRSKGARMESIAE